MGHKIMSEEPFRLATDSSNVYSGRSHAATLRK